MKKLLVIFVLLLAIVLAVGCNARKKPITSSDETKTVVTLEQDDAAPLNINDPLQGGADELAVTSFDGNRLETNKNYNLIRGTAPEEAKAIEINGYKLRFFKPGQREWRYIASEAIGTLVKGDNNYLVRALDQEGQEISSTSFEITYNSLAAPNKLPGVGTSLWTTMLLAVAISLMGFQINVLKSKH